MKYCFLIILFLANFGFSQTDSQADRFSGKWSFSKRICISQFDTLIQIPDPNRSIATDTTRPFFDLELKADGTYLSEIAFFKSKGEYYSGTWKTNELNEIVFISQLDNDPGLELNKLTMKLIDNQLIFNNNTGCVYQFRRK
jgi:hypothetical protein